MESDTRDSAVTVQSACSSMAIQNCLLGHGRRACAGGARCFPELGMENCPAGTTTCGYGTVTTAVVVARSGRSLWAREEHDSRDKRSSGAASSAGFDLGLARDIACLLPHRAYPPAACGSVF